LKPAPFEYVAPESLEEALEALQQNIPDAKILAGGQSLMPLLNLRLIKPKIIIDLHRISGLNSIQEVSGRLSIGATTRQSTLERSQLVRERCPILAEATKHIGHAAVRHRGTIGGSLVHADPAAELPAVALALDATLEVIRNGLSRTIPAEEFFIDYLTTALGPDEILKEIIFPFLQPSTGYAVEELTRRHGDFAIAGVATAVDLDGDAKIADARIALFGVAPTAVRARRAEAALKGQKPDPNVIRDAATLLDDALDPPSDIHASSAYRKHVATVLTVRALERAVQVCQKRGT
jgi:CO/xanthine dehydrogenase FAD-binding subunit